MGTHIRTSVMLTCDSAALVLLGLFLCYSLFFCVILFFFGVILRSCVVRSFFVLLGLFRHVWQVTYKDT